MDKKGKKTFEDALSQLESIVAQLEDGDLPLAESLKLFEEGIKLSRFCNQKLNEAQKKVEVLLKENGGDLEPHPFEQEETTEGE
ncbi:MAG: exodeoxyribonuclease VII small subunit [Syntrophobacterales bacterium]|nr:MAG: exodeoxyribonuclease VII small subunit [Syntrophobacterales bacterium]